MLSVASVQWFSICFISTSVMTAIAITITITMSLTPINNNIISEEREKRNEVWLQIFTLAERAIKHWSPRDEMTGSVF